MRGIDGVAVEVEVLLSPQLPRIDIVGLPEAAVRESAARVRAAIGSIGQSFPRNRVTVNLAPANLRKRGAGLDLAIAIGILGAAGVFEEEQLEKIGLVGELALDGRLRPIQGALALTLALRDAGRNCVIVPSGNALEAALTPQVEVLHAPLTELARERPTQKPFGDCVRNTSTSPPVPPNASSRTRARRCAWIAASGSPLSFSTCARAERQRESSTSA